MTAPGFFESLERQLGDGFDRTVARRRARRRAVERLGGFALGLVAVALTLVLVLAQDGAEAGVSVQTRGGLVYVRLFELEHDAEKIERAAAEAGLDITVEEIAVGPSLVGRFVHEEHSADALGELKALDPDGPAFAGFVVPAGYEGRLVLRVGRPAEDGEPYATLTNALSEREPLACSGIQDESPARALELVERAGLTARWSVNTAQGTRPIPVDEVEDPDHADLRVDRVLALDDHTVAVVLSDGETPLPPLELTAPASC